MSRRAAQMLIATLLLWGGVAAAQSGEGSGPAPDAQIELTLSGPTTSVRVGEPFPLVGTLTAAPGASVVSLDIQDGAWGRVLELTTSVGGRPEELRLQATAVIFRPGRFVLTDATATVLLPDGSQASAQADALMVEVASVIANESAPEPAGSAPPFPVMTRDLRPVIAGSVLLTLLLGLALGALIRRLRPAPPEETPAGPPPVPAWELALQALDRLEQDALLDEGRPLEFHMRLSEVLRAYLGARFAFHALEATTSEIALALAARPDEVGAWRQEILRVLRDMDLVKFARYAPARDDSEALLASSRRLVLDLSARERSVSQGTDEVPEPIEAETEAIPEPIDSDRPSEGLASDEEVSS